MGRVADEAVRLAVEEGLTQNEASLRLEMPKSTVRKRAAKLGLKFVNKPGPRPYTWNDVRDKHDWHLVDSYYQAGHSAFDTVNHFGITWTTWKLAMNAGAVKAKSEMPIEAHLVANGHPTSTPRLRERLIREGIKEARCEHCGLTEWLGKPIPLELHHRNGIRSDNRLDNLEIVCPNCHSFTDTYRGRNIGKGSNILQEESIPLISTGL